jgi:c-di-GMP-binding flagellar brake protein YcgR
MDNEFFFKVLFNAIEEGNSISLGRMSDKEDLFHFSSRFFSYDENRNEILIDIPSSSDNNDILKISDNVEVFFISKSLRLGFYSKILGFSEFKLVSGEVVPAMVMAKPKEGLDLQRRRDFRVPTPPLNITVSFVENTENKEQENKIIMKCVSYDISRSGIAISKDKRKKDLIKLEKNMPVSMIIDLDGNAVQMEGTVESKRELYEGKKIVVGVDFEENKPDKVEYKRNLSIIMKYIMKRQREIMLKV